MRLAHHPYHMGDQRFWYRKHPILLDGKLHHLDRHLHLWLFCVVISQYGVSE